MKRIIISLLALLSFLSVNAQSNLELLGNGFSIGPNQYISESDGYIYLDSIIEINNVTLGEGVKDNNKHEIRIYQPTNDSIVFNQLMKSNFKANFLVGNDTILVFIDNVLRYSVVSTPKYNTPDNKTILTVYKDSIHVASKDTIYVSAKKGDTYRIKKPISVNWLSLRMFDKKKHEVSIQKIGKNALTLYGSSIVTEDSCSINIGNDTISVILDNDPLCIIAPEVIEIDDEYSKIWIAVIAVIGFVLLLVLIELVMRRAANRPMNSQVSDVNTDKHSDVRVEKVEITTDLPFEQIWNKLTEQQQSDAVQQLKSTHHLINIGELRFDQLLQSMTEEQSAAAKQKFQQEVNMKDEVQKLSEGDLFLLMTEDQKDAAKQRFLQEVNMKDEIQKLSFEKLIELISEEQEKQLTELYKTTETITNTVIKTVDVKEMSANDLFAAMDSNQLMEIVSLYPQRKLAIPQTFWQYVFQQIRGNNQTTVFQNFLVDYFKNDSVSNDVLEAVSSRMLTTDDISEKKYAFGIMQEMLRKDEEDIWDYVAKVIAGKVNPVIEDISCHYPDKWNELFSILSNPNVTQFDFVNIKQELETTKATLFMTEQELESTKGALTTAEQELETTKGALTTTEQQLETTKGALSTTRQELETTKGTLSTTRQELETTKGTLSTTRQELETTKGALSTTEQELETTKGTLSTTKQELETTKGMLSTTEQELETTKGALTTTEQELETTKGTLSTTRQELETTKGTLSTTGQELETIIQKWIDSMKNLRDDMMSIPLEIIDGYAGIYSGDNSVMSGMVDRVINDRRSNLLKFIDKGNAIEIDKNTTMDAIKVSIRELFIDDLGGQYPGWVDILMRLYAYTKVSFLREDLKKNGLNVDYVTSAAEQTLQLMKLVDIHAVIPDLFKSKYDNTVYDLEPIRTIDRIIPSASTHAKSGIVADIYRIGYTIESMNQSKKAIVSIY